MVHYTKETPLEKLRRNPIIHKVKRFKSYNVRVDPRNGYTDCEATCEYTGETIRKSYQDTPTKARQRFITACQYLTL